jgi:hypothetical protein
MNTLSGKPTSKFSVALGGVSCTFKKELRPYESYDVWTRILSWDQKWVYIVSHFVRRGTRLEPEQYTLYPQQKPKPSGEQRLDKAMPQSKASPVVASALSKIVFKDGRRTIAPQSMLEMAELLPSEECDLRSEIEGGRIEGLRMADLLAKQSSLEEEFKGQLALGRHHDGLGIEGVVATFAQLGGLSHRQLV